MAAFLAMYILVYGGIQAYFAVKVCRALPRHPGLIWVVVTWAVLMLLAPIVSRLLERAEFQAASALVSWVAVWWMAWVFWFFSFGLLMDLWNGASHFLSIPHIPNRFGLIGLVGLIAVLSVWGSIEARMLRVEELAFEADITQPITIAQVSDLHLGPNLSTGQWRQVVDALHAQAPDLIVSTGDLVDTSLSVIDAPLDALAALQPPLGKLAVTGNHEYYPGLEKTLDFHERAGFTMLRGETWERHGLAVSGVDDPAGKVTGQSSFLEEDVLADKGAAFHILLKHQPRIQPDSIGRFDLQLSGHVHDGQIFPFGLLTRLAYGRGAGLFDLGQGTHIYISRGTGTWGPPLRVGAPPELTMIELLPRQKASTN